MKGFKLYKWLISECSFCFFLPPRPECKNIIGTQAEYSKKIMTTKRCVTRKNDKKKFLPCCCLFHSLCTYCQDIKIFFIQLTVHSKGMREWGRITGRKVNHLTWDDNLLTWSISKTSTRWGDESHMAYDFMYEDIHRR